MSTEAWMWVIACIVTGALLGLRRILKAAETRLRIALDDHRDTRPSPTRWTLDDCISHRALSDDETVWEHELVGDAPYDWKDGGL